MLILQLVLFFLPFTNCQYFTKDEVDIILSISKNQLIKHLIIAAKEPKKIIQYGIQKLIKEKYFITILDIFYIEGYLKHVPVGFYKSAIIMKEGVFGIKLVQDKTDRDFLPYETVDENFISFYTWIIFDNQKETYSKSLKSFYLPYNSILLLVSKPRGRFYNITEIYNTDYNKKKAESGVFDSFIQLRNLFGTWARDEGLSNVPGFYERRFNLRWTRFVVTGKLPEEDFFYATALFELWKDMYKAMNFTYVWLHEYYVVQHRLFTDVWMHLAPITASNFRKGFVGPVFTNNIYMHIKDDFNDDYDWTSLFKPFSLKIWFYLLIWLIIPGTLLVIYEQRKKEENKDNFGASMAPFDVLCGQWALDDRKTFSWRIAIFFILTSGMFFLNSYTAVFTSFLTIPNPQLPFMDLEGFINDGTYMIGSSDSFIREQAKETIAHITQANAEKYIFHQFNFHHKVAVDRLCSNRKFVLLLENKNGIVAERFFKTCKIFKIPKPIMKQYLSFLVRTLSPYQEIFNMFFMTARSNGVLKRLDKSKGKVEELFYGVPWKRELDTEEFDFTATISQLFTVLKIILFGWLISLIIFIGELITKIIFTKRN